MPTPPRAIAGVLALFLALLGAGAPIPALGGEVYIGITSDAERAPIVKLGLAPFRPLRPQNPEDALRALKIRQIIGEDLLFSRYFEIVEKGPALVEGLDEQSRKSWMALGAQTLISARAGEGGSEVLLEAVLYDLKSGEALLQKSYKDDSSDWRQAAHRFSDLALNQLTGKKGIASSRIAFVNDQSGFKEVYVMDYDGENLKKMTEEKSIVLLPRWTADGRSIAFTTYRRKNPDLYQISLQSSKPLPLSTLQGLNLAGGFSQDGKLLALTLSHFANPNVYLMTLENKEIKRLTSHSGVDSSPVFSPDGSEVAYISDRSGNPQLYVMELKTGRTRRLTYVNWCDAPIWQPTGEWIAVSARASQRDPLEIYLVDVAAERMVQITRGKGSNEDPAWSPDGRFLAFSSTRSGRRKIYVMDADGSAPRPFGNIAGNSSTPAWSP